MPKREVQHFIDKFGQLPVECAPSDPFDVADAFRDFHSELPAAYLAFLTIAGNGFAPFEGTLHTLDDQLCALQRSVPRMAKDDAGVPSDAFVFFAHQGFAFRYFLLSAEQNPPVFEFVKGREPTNNKLSPSFVDFIQQSSRDGG